MRRGFAAALLALGLTACAGVAERPSAPPRSLPALDAYTVDGRFAVSGTAQPVSGRLNWQHAGERDAVLLQDPFGRGLAELVLAPGGAELRRSDGTVTRAMTAGDLARQLFDLALPLEQLGGWMTARLGPSVDGAEYDESGRLVAWRLAEWAIRYDYDYGDAEANDLPSGVNMSRDDGVVVRLRIDRWDLGGGPP